MPGYFIIAFHTFLFWCQIKIRQIWLLLDQKITGLTIKEVEERELHVHGVNIYMYMYIYYNYYQKK